MRTFGTAPVVSALTSAYTTLVSSAPDRMRQFQKVLLAMLPPTTFSLLDVVLGSAPDWEGSAGAFDPARLAALRGAPEFLRAVDAWLRPRQSTDDPELLARLRIPQDVLAAGQLADRARTQVPGFTELSGERQLALALLDLGGDPRELGAADRSSASDAVRELASRQQQPARRWWREPIPQAAAVVQPGRVFEEGLAGVLFDDPGQAGRAAAQPSRHAPGTVPALYEYVGSASATTPRGWARFADGTRLREVRARWAEPEDEFGVPYWHVQVTDAERGPAAGDDQLPPGPGVIPSPDDTDMESGTGSDADVERDSRASSAVASRGAAPGVSSLSHGVPRGVREPSPATGVFRHGTAGVGRFFAGFHSPRGWAVREPFLPLLPTVDTLFEWPATVGQGARGHGLGFGPGVLFFFGHGGVVPPEQVARYAAWRVFQPGGAGLSDLWVLFCGDGGERPTAAYEELTSRWNGTVWEFTAPGALGWADGSGLRAALHALPDGQGRPSYVRAYRGGRVSRVPEPGAAGTGWRTDVPFPDEELVNRGSSTVRVGPRTPWEERLLTHHERGEAHATRGMVELADLTDGATMVERPEHQLIPPMETFTALHYGGRVPPGERDVEPGTRLNLGAFLAPARPQPESAVAGLYAVERVEFTGRQAGRAAAAGYFNQRPGHRGAVVLRQAAGGHRGRLPGVARRRRTRLGTAADTAVARGACGDGLGGRAQRLPRGEPRPHPLGRPAGERGRAEQPGRGVRRHRAGGQRGRTGGRRAGLAWAGPRVGAAPARRPGADGRHAGARGRASPAPCAGAPGLPGRSELGRVRARRRRAGTAPAGHLGTGGRRRPSPSRCTGTPHRGWRTRPACRPCTRTTATAVSPRTPGTRMPPGTPRAAVPRRTRWTRWATAASWSCRTAPPPGTPSTAASPRTTRSSWNRPCCSRRAARP
ncbi:hypothetical protein ACWV95_20175 [Streptomyces albus]